MPRTTMQAFARSIGVRLFAVVAVGLASILPAFGSPHASQAASDETYVSETYGYAITYPTPDWTIFVLGSGEEDDVLLALQGGGAAEFAGQPANDEDMDACLDSLMTKLQARPKLVDFTLIRRGYTEPDLPGAGAAEMYSYLSGDDQAANVGYFECRELPDGNGFVTIFAASPEEIWEDFVPVFEELMAGFDDGSDSESSDDGPDDENDGGPVIGVKTPTSNDEEDNENAGEDREGGLQGNTYTGIYVDFSVTWNEEVWGDPETDSDPDGSWESIGVYGDLGYAYIEAVIPEKARLDISDAESCMDVYTGFMANGDGVSDFGPVRRADLPETSPDAVGGVYGYLYTETNGEEYDTQTYAECRQVSSDSYLFMRMNTGPEVWDEALVEIEELLAGLRIGESRATSEDGKDQDGDLSTYEGVKFGFQVSWDRQFWGVPNTGVDENGAYEWLEFPDDTAWLYIEAIRPAYLADQETWGFTDVEGCFQAYFNGNLAIPDVEDLVEDRRRDVPESADDVVSGSYTFTITQGDQTTDLHTYLECRQLADGEFLFIRMNAYPENWERAVPELERVLASVAAGTGTTLTDQPLASGGADLLTAPIWLPRPSQIPGITVGEETRRFRLSA